MNSFNNIADGAKELNRAENKTCDNCVFLPGCRFIFESAFPKEKVFNHKLLKACHVFKDKATFAEIIRCGECTHYDPKTKTCEEFTSDRLPTGGRLAFIFEADHFCNKGERKY